MMAKRKRKTKKDKAIELYSSFSHLPEKELIQTFLKELKLPSENAARTYLSMSKKEVNPNAVKKRKIDEGKTKRGRAMELFNKNKKLNRKEMIDLFQKELNMSHNSAAMHCSICANNFTGKWHNAIE